MVGDHKSPLVTKFAGFIYWLEEDVIPQALVAKRFSYFGEDAGKETWTLGSFLLSVYLLAMSTPAGIAPLEIAVLAVACIRLFEIWTKATSAFFFHRFWLPGSKWQPPLAGPRRIILLLFINYAEVVTWFALIYRNLEDHFDGADINDFFRALHTSFVSASGVGSTLAIPSSPIGILLSIVQGGLALFLVVAVFARFVALFSTTET